MTYEYDTLKCSMEARVMTVLIDAPPANVMTRQLYRDLAAFTADVESDETVQVVVFDSADPDFFIAHFDIELLIGVSPDSSVERGVAPTHFHDMCKRLATMPKATIVKMRGRAGGGGNEFASNCDMRFGIRGRTIVNQMEVALGILPGGTGTQTLPGLIGRNRALEVILGADDIDAQTLEAWGYLNRAFDTELELDEFVDRLVTRIASWPAEAVALAKQSVNLGSTVDDGNMIDEAYLFQQLLRTEGAQRNMRRAMDLGAQTREGELRMGELCREVGRSE